MTWFSLLLSLNGMVLAVAPATVDRIVVWGALVLLICMISWRQLTLPALPPPDAPPPSV
jgi:ABC-type Mn2+/Zn2+ transport system permease subunit